MKKSLKSSPNIYLAGIFACSILFVLPIWLYGIPQSHDTIHHFQTANALYDLIVSGKIFPVWSGGQNSDYGGIVLRIYPPAAYFVLAIGRFIGGNWQNAAYFAFTFWTAIGGLGTYFWCREYFSEKSSFVAAILFVFSPYHAIQLYGAFLYAEFAAVSLLPFCFLFLTKIARKPSLQNIVGLGASYALLSMTHLPVAFMGSAAIFLYFVLLPKKIGFKKSFVGFSAGILFGLAASCYQWIRVLSEMNFVGIAGEKFSASGFYDYRENFLLTFPYLNGFDADIHSLWFLDLSLAFTLLIIVPCGILFWKKSLNKNGNELKAAILTSIFAILMMLMPSYPLWENFSLLQKIQFPWRWLGILTVTGIIFVAGGVEYFKEIARPKTRPLLLLVIGSLVLGICFTSFQVIRQAIFIGGEDFASLIKKLPTGNDFDEWLPVWANKNTSSIKEKITSDRNYQITLWKPTEKEFKIESGNASDIRIAAFYYPFWKATVNNQAASVKPSQDGAILISLPSEESTVSLVFSEPGINIFSFYLTFAVWFAIGFFLIQKALFRTET